MSMLPNNWKKLLYTNVALRSSIPLFTVLVAWGNSACRAYCVLPEPTLIAPDYRHIHFFPQNDHTYSFCLLELINIFA